MPRRSYTSEQRAEALALYATDGPTAVQEAMGIPKQTVDSWARADGVQTVRNERTAAAVEARSLEWAERRLALVHEMGRVAEKALSAAELAVDSLASSKAKDFATTMAILVDKAQLLAGSPTQRPVFDLTARGEVVNDARDRGLSLVPRSA